MAQRMSDDIARAARRRTRMVVATVAIVIVGIAVVVAGLVVAVGPRGAPQRLYLRRTAPAASAGDAPSIPFARPSSMRR